MKITKRPKVNDVRTIRYTITNTSCKVYNIDEDCYELEIGDVVEITEKFVSKAFAMLGYMKDDPYDGYWEVISIKEVDSE